ncbi:gastrin/cholecystokinin type B receptor-like, partial [Musca vetustissima]|uniref:gastrin/cholecystokinin type B receptor-like n=1 Tax=Musca vetustissima TaxID=27455 RepID=UPI002AB66F42
NEFAALALWPDTNSLLDLQLSDPILGYQNVTQPLDWYEEDSSFNASAYDYFVNSNNNSTEDNNTTIITRNGTAESTVYIVATSTVGPHRSSTTRSSAFEVPIWLILCYSIILLFAIVGNLLVIVILAQNRRMRTITNVFLLNLAISDILLGVLCMPVTLVGTLLRHFIFGEFFCKLIQFSQAASVAVSSWTLVAISCERYYAICHPLRSRRWQTRSHAYKIIACIWFGSMLCMTPIAIFSQLMPTSRQGYRKCRENWPTYALPYERPYNIFLDLVLLVLPLVILSVAYTLITRTLYVGMRIEKAMIFGGGSGSGPSTGNINNCNGKLNSNELYSTIHTKCGSSYSMTSCGGKGAYLSTTTTTSTPTSSMTTLASTSSAVSRLRFQFSLRRHGPKTITNVTMKLNGDGCCGGAGGNATTAGSNIGSGGSIMRSHFSLNKENHLDDTIQETDIFQQQQQHQKPSSTKHYQQQYGNQHQRLFQQQHQPQQQNHCHNYHQHQMLLHHESDQDQQHHSF